MRSSADARVRARTRRKKRARSANVLLIVLALVAMAVALYFIAWPTNLIVAVPLGIMVLWLVMANRVAR